MKTVGAVRNRLLIRLLSALELFVYRSCDHIVPVTEAFRRYILGRGIAATPDRVVAFLRDAVADAGINYVVCQFVFGTMNGEFASRSISLFAREVMPVVRSAHPTAT